MFAFDSEDISAQFYPVLDSVSLVLDEFDQTFVEVAGHTDSVGTTECNQQLSERRADSVAAYLVSRDIDRQRLIAIGGGENYPIGNNSTDAGRAMNRRVELTIVPVTT